MHRQEKGASGGQGFVDWELRGCGIWGQRPKIWGRGSGIWRELLDLARSERFGIWEIRDLGDSGSGRFGIGPYLGDSGSGLI